MANPCFSADLDVWAAAQYVGRCSPLVNRQDSVPRHARFFWKNAQSVLASEPGRIIHALLHLSLIVHPIIYHLVFLSRNLIFMRDPSSSLTDQNEEA